MTGNSPASGVFAPVLTPMRSDLSPDPERFAALCRSLLDDGCHGLVLFGTASEANSLSADERVALLEGVAAAGVAPAKLIVGTGLCAIPETARLTRHAVGLGCNRVLALPPPGPASCRVRTRLWKQAARASGSAEIAATAPDSKARVVNFWESTTAITEERGRERRSASRSSIE